ncbi:MAG: heterodisulfide reductase-related iron-sulfur binding cluster [Myxococcota bacterium]
MSDDVLTPMPTEGLCTDPKKAKYWQFEMLDLEVTRQFEVCHECRLCTEFCEVFPTLYTLVDEGHEGNVTMLTAGEVNDVMDACFQCKLCEVRCPYTPQKGHDYQLDLPKLVHRYKAVRAREQGLTARDRMLGNPDALGQLARSSGRLGRQAKPGGLVRWALATFMGIDRNSPLPDFAATSFEAWASNAGATAKRSEPVGTVLFATCFVNNHRPEIGRDTLEVFDRNDIACKVVTGAGCCGMPAWETGDYGRVRKLAETVLDRVHPHIENGAKLVVPNPTCARMLRDAYPELLDDPRTSAVAKAVVSPEELLGERQQAGTLNTAFTQVPERIAYHTACHLCARRIGRPGRDLLAQLPGTCIETIESCCGQGGTYGMKAESADTAMRVGASTIDAMIDAGADVWVSECAGASLAFEHGKGRKPEHPMTVLAKAYRGDR